MDDELETVKTKFSELMRSELRTFPPAGNGLDETEDSGVYVIYSPLEKVLHVGATPRAEKGIRQRLANHLYGQSSFTRDSRYLKDQAGDDLKERRAYVREHCRYRCLPVKEHRIRALLEAYSIGNLCPDHIGLHQAACD